MLEVLIAVVWINFIVTLVLAWQVRRLRKKPAEDLAEVLADYADAIAVEIRRQDDRIQKRLSRHPETDEDNGGLEQFKTGQILPGQPIGKYIRR